MRTKRPLESTGQPADTAPDAVLGTPAAAPGSGSAEFLHRHQHLVIDDEMVGERGYLALDGIDVICIPSFTEVSIDDQERTAVRMLVEPR